MRLHNKVVFITDADSPSGRAILLRMAAEGASFIVNSASEGREIAGELDQVRQLGGAARVVRSELTNSSEVAELLKEASVHTGTVDILVHNNDLVVPISVEHGDEMTFLKIMNANAKSAFICAQAAGRQMEAKQRGSIVFVSSIHAEKPTGSSFAYSASKGAVKMLAREASVVLGRQGVNVNTIEFGPVEGDDERFRSDLSLLYDSYRCKVPSAVLGTHEELAELALFLCTDEARYINGADIRMDGGFLMHYLNFKTKQAVRTGGAI